MPGLPDEKALTDTELRLNELLESAKTASIETNHVQRMEPHLLEAQLRLEHIRTLRALYEKLDAIDQVLVQINQTLIAKQAVQ